MELATQTKPKVAVLITGTYREVEFILQFFPYMAGSIDYDIFLALRHVLRSELSHIGAKERDFEIRQLEPFLNKNIFLCELPNIDPETATSRYLIPVGPTDVRRECSILSMFYGIFTAISMMKSSLRNYTHVMKMRTDYLPWVAPWVSGMLEAYWRAGNKIIVDGCATWSRRYPDRLDILWQGSLSDVFTFASYEQFLKLWDFEDILQKIWTGIPETTLFRAAMIRFLGDDLQSPRRNESFLKKFFFWEPNDTKQPLTLLRSNVLSEDLKQMILVLAKEQKVTVELINQLIQISYQFIMGKTDESQLEQLVFKCFPQKEAKVYLEVCHSAMGKACPI